MSRWSKLVSELTFYKGHRNDSGYVSFGDESKPWTPEMEGMSVVESGSREGQIVSSLITDSTGVGSAIWGPGGMHKVALDIDMEVVVTPSTTPGHYHLYIDKVMPWAKYQKLLIALADAGIIERGYLEVSVRRKATHLRAPWYKKS